MEKITCSQLRIKLAEIKDLKKEFDLEMGKIRETRSVEIIFELQKGIKKMQRELFIKGYEISKNESESLKKFFGFLVDVPDLPGEITNERLEKWKKQGFELHYMPDIKMDKDDKYPGWKVKPNMYDEFGLYKKIENGVLKEESAFLKSGWVLIETIKKPWRLSMGQRQEYQDDIFADAIVKLKDEGVIDEKLINTKDNEREPILRNSRCCLSVLDLEKEEVKKAFAEILDVKMDMISLPRAIELNALGNMYYPDFGNANSSEICSDYGNNGECTHFGFEKTRALSEISVKNRDYRSSASGFRLMVRFDQK